MREIKTEIQISASPDKVWSIISNIKNWYEWSPIIQKSKGDPFLGAKLSIIMTGKEGKGGKDGPSYQPIITFFNEAKSFRWRAKMIAGFIFTNDKSFELEATPDGTRLIHKEYFKGLLVPMFWNSIKTTVPSMLNSMNEALKKKVETK